MNTALRAMRLERPGTPLHAVGMVRRPPAAGDVRIRVGACGVCRTDLHVVDGELPDPKLPVVPGHEIVGRVAAVGEGVTRFKPGDRVGVPWLGWACGVCEYCRAGKENLCPCAHFTGYQIDGGFANETVADARFVFPVPGDSIPTRKPRRSCARAYRLALPQGGGRANGWGFTALAPPPIS